MQSFQPLEALISLWGSHSPDHIRVTNIRGPEFLQFKSASYLQDLGVSSGSATAVGSMSGTSYVGKGPPDASRGLGSAGE